MRALVTGITGFVGSELAQRLRADGHDVVGYSRDRAHSSLDVPVVVGDATTGAGLTDALSGIDVAYYNIHSLESGSTESFATRDRRAVRNFVRAAEQAGVGRVVYLSVHHPANGRPVSPHLASRFEVERRLLDSSVPCVAVRTNFVVSARNRQFRHMAALVEQLPAIVLPPFHAAKNAPLDSRDVISCLVQAADPSVAAPSTYDIAGPEVLTFGEMMVRLAAVMGVEREVLANSMPAAELTPELMSSVTGIDPDFIGPLLQTAEFDLLPVTDQSASLGLVAKISYDAAVAHALEELAMAPGRISAART